MQMRYGKLKRHIIWFPPVFISIEHLRKAADERFRRELLSIRGKDSVSATTTQGNTHSAEADNSKVAIVTFLAESPKKAYHSMQSYEDLYPITSASLQKYADRHGYDLIIHREPVRMFQLAYW